MKILTEASLSFTTTAERVIVRNGKAKFGYTAFGFGTDESDAPAVVAYAIAASSIWICIVLGSAVVSVFLSVALESSKTHPQTLRPPCPRPSI